MKTRPYVFAGLAVCAIASSLAAQQTVVNQEVRILPGGTSIDSVAGLPGAGPSNTPMPMGTAVVFGQVTEADSSRPVAGAIVTLSIPGAQPLRVMALRFSRPAEGPLQPGKHPAGLGGWRIRPDAAGRHRAWNFAGGRRKGFRSRGADVALCLHHRHGGRRTG
jgi:hypothetical protein